MGLLNGAKLMTLMLYPNKKEPKGWRLQDKALNVNLYFPASKYKTMSLAKEAGRIEEHKLLIGAKK